MESKVPWFGRVLYSVQDEGGESKVPRVGRVSYSVQVKEGGGGGGWRVKYLGLGGYYILCRLKYHLV